MILISSLLIFFLLSMSFGINFFYPIVPVKDMGEGFIKLINVISGLSLLGAFLVTQFFSPLKAASFAFSSETIFYLIGVLASLLMYFIHRPQKTIGTFFIYGVQMVSCLTVLWFFSESIFISFFYNILSCLFFGAVTFAMILGHWYLVVPKLSERPLKRMHYFLWVLLSVKVILTIASYFNHEAFFNMNTELGGGFSFNWLMLSMRVGWGYLVVGIMSIFSWKLVSIRSIQSATGMLYAMTFFIFVGELLAHYFFKQYGLML